MLGTNMTNLFLTSKCKNKMFVVNDQTLDFWNENVPNSIIVEISLFHYSLTSDQTVFN